LRIMRRLNAHLSGTVLIYEVRAIGGMSEKVDAA
jgi:hypothetical protein